MAITPSMKRGAATTAGGALVLGAGMSVGILAAGMQHAWASESALRQQAEVQGVATTVVPDPVVITRIRVRHVTPEPEVVHKKVYRTVPGSSSSGTSAARRSTSSRTGSGSGTSGASRTTVAPAPRPAPARAKAPASTTSKTS
jgi:hypothetical protein